MGHGDPGNKSAGWEVLEVLVEAVHKTVPWDVLVEVRDRVELSLGEGLVVGAARWWGPGWWRRNGFSASVGSNPFVSLTLSIGCSVGVSAGGWRVRAPSSEATCASARPSALSAMWPVLPSGRGRGVASTDIVAGMVSWVVASGCVLAVGGVDDLASCRWLSPDVSICWGLRGSAERGGVARLSLGLFRFSRMPVVVAGEMVGACAVFGLRQPGSLWREWWWWGLGAGGAA